MEELERKYIDLILKRCLNFEQSKSLMINCDFKEHVEFALKVKERANELGILDVCINVNDLDDIHEYLKNTDIEDIVVNPLIDRSNWDKYAIKGGAILFLSSTVPGLMDDIEEEKITKWVKEREKTTRYYRKNVSKYTFPWTIAALPNERWANIVFKNDTNAYQKLYLTIMKMCMIDRENPIEEWNKYIKENNYYKDILNSLNITKMHYTNSLGTDLNIEIPSNNTWINLDKPDALGNQMIANMPSYEIFTSPDYRKTNGIVYASKPLYYNDTCINDFYLEFKDGKIVSCYAKEGQKLLEKMISTHENASYLGEVALVPYNSPISNTGLVFNETLFDENASCHLALGDGFMKCFADHDKLTEEELKEKGLNVSNMHVDFMIGTGDLKIEAQTNKGKILIFKNGNFNL
ncbi:MAG: aminopeptidase [Lactobacillales bacterium]|nr:aminopeptidase [Lactobacillales bacterium]